MATNDPVEKLLSKIRRSAKTLGRKPKQLAKDVLGDGKAYQRLIDGWRGISLERIDNANAALNELLESPPSKKKPSARLAA